MPSRRKTQLRSSIRANEQAEEKARRENVALRREIHKLLLDHLDLATVEPSKLEDPSLRPKVLNALRRIVRSIDQTIPESINRDALIGELADEALGLGPLERFLSDPSVNEIMVVDPDTIYIEQKGKLFQSEARFTDDERVRAVIERIVTPLGRRIDESSPLVDARLSDGSRVNAVIRPLALRGSAITIRKFSRSPLDLEKLVSFGALTKQMGSFLTRCVIAKKNIVIAGGTGSGKTTLLNVLSGAIPSDERIVTIEDAAELQLRQPHVVSLETRPANMEGKGEYSIRDLVKNALRMRPDRIVVGECRGGEALDMLQAMNTGHDGSLTTTHANSAREAVARLETLCLMAGIRAPGACDPRADCRERAPPRSAVAPLRREPEGDGDHGSGRDQRRGRRRARPHLPVLSDRDGRQGEGPRRVPRDRLPPHVLERLHRHGTDEARGGVPVKLHITKLLALKLGGLALAFVGFACLFNVAVYGDTFVTRLWSKYTNYLDKTLRLLFLEGSSKKIVQWQGALIGGVLTIEVGFVEVPYWYFIVPAIAIGPALWLSQERKRESRSSSSRLTASSSRSPTR